MRKCLLLVVILTCFQTTAYAHKTTLDSYGCHNNAAMVWYECHTGPLAGKTWPNPGGKAAMLIELANVALAPPIVTSGASLTWQPVPTATGYKVYWGVKQDEWQAPITIGATSSIDLTGLLKGATYFFAVTAFNEAGESEKSNVVSKDVR